MMPFSVNAWSSAVAIGLGLVAGAVPAAAQNPSLRDLGRSVLEACKGRATCAEADFYSGTLEWSESLNASIGSGGNRSLSTRTLSIRMVVTSGRVQCNGTVHEKSQRWSSGILEEDRLATGPIAGPGLIRIEFGQGGTHTVGGNDIDLDPDVPSYNVAVVCPSPRLTVTGGGQSETTPSEPARWGSSWETQSYDWLGDFSQSGLTGAVTSDHPDADPTNGIRGSVTVKWSLTKSKLPPP